MAWLIPSVIATMSGTAILSFCYFYLYSIEKKNYLKIWALSWTIYFTRFVFLLFMLLWQKSPILLIGNQLASLVSGILLLYGAYLFLEKKFPPSFFYGAILGGLWIFYSILNNLSFFIMAFPTFTFLAAVYIWTGYIFFKYSKNEQKESLIVGTTFILWGIHKANYPFLKPVIWFAPWGYLIAATLTFIIAIGLLIVYFRRTKDDLIKNEDRLKTLIKKSPLPMVITDQNQDILHYNDKFTELFGYTIEDIQTAEEWWETTYPESDYREKVQQAWITAIKEADKKNEDIKMQEWYLTIKDGTKRCCEFYMVPLGDVSFIIMNDITQRKESENEIGKQKRLFETMFNTIPDGVVITDTQRNIILANKGMESTFGYRPEDLVGNSTQMLYASSDKYQEAGTVVFDKNTKKQGELYITLYHGKNGKEFHGETFGAKLFDENNQWIGNLGIMRDITDRKQLEEQLRQTQKIESIGNLAGGIAHDFNNLLFPIIGMAEMLLEDLPNDSLEYENAQEIYNAGRRAGDLVKQILAFSRQSEHKMTPVRIQKILKEVLKLSRSTIPTNIEIQEDIDWKCGLVIADATQIHQVAMNLITNALHAIEEKNGKIVVTLKQIEFEKDEIPECSLHSGKYIKLSITDNGTGISKSVQNKIFDPYFTTKQAGKGTGLGLAVVYGIIKEHNGDIKVYSEEGLGSTFNVYLPLVKTTAIPVLDNQPLRLPTGTEKILLVDDEKSVSRLESQMLSRLGYQVTEYTDSLEALNKFKINPERYDLVISDMTMPNMTGDQLAREILSIKPSMPIIICTGFSERVNEEQALVIGVKGFLMKPVVKYDMAEMVRNVLDAAKNS